MRSWILLVITALFHLAPLAAAQPAPAIEPATQPTTQPDAPALFRFVAIADTHISHPSELARFRSFLLTIQDARPDFVVILGDICGHAPEYLPQIREVIEKSGLTVHAVPGNHDDNYGKNREWFSSVFRPHYSFDHKGWRFVISDSQTLPPPEWLAEQLAGAEGRPVVYCQHYPPKEKPEDQPWAQLIGRPKTSILTGHWHRRFQGKIGGHPFEVLGACFFTGGRSGQYYFVDALEDGRTRVKAQPLGDLELREPADRLPSVTVREPREGTIMADEVVFSGSASDDQGVKRVEYSVDFGAWKMAEGTEKWQFTVDTKALEDGHHFFRVRAVDSADQPTIEMSTVLAMVENKPRRAERTFSMQQGVDGYDGCGDATVRRPDRPKRPSGAEGEASDLECWTGRAAGGEFCEFYLKFDLAKAGVPKDAKIKRVTLTLFGSRQNQVDEEGKLCRYMVGVVGAPWKGPMSFQDRPAKPGWLAPAEVDPQAVLAGAWPYLGGRQILVPPQPVIIDLTAIRETVQGWLAEPATNHGLVFSPLIGKAYNMSAKGVGYHIPTLRPKLEIEVE